jgi:hypothetical protein
MIFSRPSCRVVISLFRLYKNLELVYWNLPNRSVRVTLL